MEFTAWRQLTTWRPAAIYGKTGKAPTQPGGGAVNVPDDFAADTGTSGAVVVGGSATGETEVGYDRDWFEVELDAGRTYEIDLEGYYTGDGTLRDPYLHGVYDANGNRLAGTTNDDGGAGRNSRVEFTAGFHGGHGTYYVAAGAMEAGEAPTRCR